MFAQHNFTKSSSSEHFNDLELFKSLYFSTVQRFEY
jgi:hypothetical protein